MEALQPLSRKVNQVINKEMAE